MTRWQRIRDLLKTDRQGKRRRLAKAGLMAAVIFGLCGCGVFNPEDSQRVEAYKRWHSARAHMAVGVGNEHLRTGELEKARAKAVEALTLDAEYVPGHLLLARVQLEAGEYAEAAEQLKRVEALASQNAQIPYLMGVAMENRGDYAAALECYQKARALDGVNDSYVQAMAECLVAMGRQRQALDLLEDRANKSNPGVELIALAGEVATMLDEHARAADYYQRCLDLSPGSLSLRESLTRAQFLAGQHGEALENLRRLEAHPNYRQKAAWVYAMMGDAQLTLNRAAEARASYQTAAELQPANAARWAALAKAALALSDDALATQSAKRALNVADDCAEASLVLGYVLARQKQWKQAVEVLAPAARRHEQDAAVVCLLGRCHAALGEKQLATACYEQVLRHYPRHALARSLLNEAAGRPLLSER